MGYIIQGDIEYGGTEKVTAGGVSYDNTQSGLPVTNIQSAVDQLNENIVEQGTHSTSETVIGTFNGQPLYRKVYKTDSANVTSGTDTTVFTNVVCGRKVVNFSFVLSRDNLTVSQSPYVSAYISSGNFVVNQTVSSSFTSATVILTVEYIK